MSYYHHFNTYERAKIEELSKLGFSTRSIAKRLSRHHSSIARELLRFRRGKSYKAEVAHADYVAKRAYSKPKGKYSKELKDLVKEKLIATWSPEQIANTATLGKLGFKSIYRWIYDGRIEGVSMLNLRRRGKKRTCNNLVLYSRGTSIRKRPKEVYTRKAFGHYVSARRPTAKPLLQSKSTEGAGYCCVQQSKGRLLCNIHRTQDKTLYSHQDARPHSRLHGAGNKASI